METRVITFFGDKLDKYGMPEPFHNYMVLAGPAQWPGAPRGSIATVVPISSAPSPPICNFFAADGSEVDAIEKAKASLRELQGNKGLKESTK
jgi:hypothetical protein